MEPDLREQGRSALGCIEDVLAGGGTSGGLSHDDIRRAVTPLVAFRDSAIARHREGKLERALLDQVNALVSLAYAALFPLAGLHIHRLEQTRDGLKSLLAQE